MRWLTLYARSRQVLASATAVALVTLAVWALHSPGPVDPVMAVLVLTANVAAVSIGLGGWDVVLERTAGIRWVPRRAAHVLLAGAIAGAALLTVQAAGVQLAPTEVVIRDSAGLVGAAALGAALLGAQFAWTLPTGWFAVTLFAPPLGGTAGQVVSWMTFPAGTAASTGTAWTLLATGTVLYALAGPKR
ncbi:hypothetical protein HEK616_83050 (plasmid) [Streptomyces nigrescens]|uniref:Integral membrane protein n=1 Tax=Streptomyces nigrescens TaxID=1920 RepID=A0ABN6R8Y4_STRNI|nr:hypothetical protein [Streptomyces nigrescens]BDM74818.1 hypothetical protein HEK616_83050 [Streptomyces nigrescens]